MNKSKYVAPYLNKRAKYTVQTFSESGNFGAPEPEDVLYASTHKDIERIMWEWWDEHERYGSGDDAYVYVWARELTDVTDQYPDYHGFIGRRGGFNLVKIG